MPTDLPPYTLEIRTAKTGMFYVAARNTDTQYLWARWEFYGQKGAAEMAMYELELARVGRTWVGPGALNGWKIIYVP
jgi:hypothetical protein